jgi:hypothetical protein
MRESLFEMTLFEMTGFEMMIFEMTIFEMAWLLAIHDQRQLQVFFLASD